MISSLPHASGSVTLSFSIQRAVFSVSVALDLDVDTIWKDYPFNLKSTKNQPLTAKTLVDDMWNAIKKAVEGIPWSRGSGGAPRTTGTGVARPHC